MYIYYIHIYIYIYTYIACQRGETQALLMKFKVCFEMIVGELIVRSHYIIMPGRRIRVWTKTPTPCRPMPLLVQLLRLRSFGSNLQGASMLGTSPLNYSPA